MNETIADMLIIKFEDLLKSNSWIKQDSQLARKLQDRKIFKRDVKVVISYVTPILPFVGLLEGTIVVATEIIEKYAESNQDKSDSDEQDDSSKAEEGRD